MYFIFQEQEKLIRIIEDIESFTMTTEMNGRDIDPLHEEAMRRAREMSVIAETMNKFLRGEGQIHSSEELFFEAQVWCNFSRLLLHNNKAAVYYEDCLRLVLLTLMLTYDI